MLLLFPLMLLSQLDGGAVADESMQVEIAGVRNDKGHILIAVYRSNDHFSEANATAFRQATIASKEGTFTATIDALPPGDYVLALIHDENDNRKIDTGFFGIPKEGYCFSKGATGVFGPPKFTAAAVSHGDGKTVQRLVVKY